jgi:hypothetical protein
VIFVTIQLGTSLKVMSETVMIRTPDQRVRVFVSSTMGEPAAERQAVRDAVTRLRLVPVMFELGARPHPPRPVYQAYLAQSQVFVGIYWQSYGWVAPGEQISGLEDEYQLSAGMPRLIYVRSPAPDREPQLTELLARIRNEGGVSYQHFSATAELQQLVENDLAVLLSERFEMSRPGMRAGDDARLTGMLPAPVTPLVGREREAASVENLVVREGVRLVTLTGPGGVGKSRLMVEAVRRLGPGFVDGARPEVVSAGSAAAAGARQLRAGEGGGTAADRAAGRGSRAPDPPDLQHYASVALFVERAHAAAPGFELTLGNADAVAQICRRLDGMPLAIELAAAWVRVLPPQALLSRLDQRFSLLTGGARDLPERQRTLRNSLDWSFGLLSAAEQALFARLGVFAGTFSLSAAEAVGADSADENQAQGAGQVMNTLGSLVDASLVRPETGGGQPRFSLLETIREYALERLREDGKWVQAHDRHAAYFLAYAEPAAATLAGTAGVAGPAGDRARQHVGRDVLAGRPRPARTGRAPVPGDLEVLVAARPPRGICPPGE